jgi:hypothetical protein
MRPGCPAATLLAIKSRKEMQMSTHDTRRELAHRVADGIEVQLLWSTSDDTVSVAVCDHRDGVVFELPVARERALHAFNHPFAYAA